MFGGKKGAGMRDSEMVEGCLGSADAVLWQVIEGEKAPAWFSTAAAADGCASKGSNRTAHEVDCKLKLGETQNMEFSDEPNCPPARRRGTPSTRRVPISRRWARTATW